MATTRFDEITSTLAETSTRRGALRFLVAAVFGAGSLALVGAQESEARRRRPVRRRPRRPGSPPRPYPHVEPRPTKSARQICVVGRDTCSGGLQCGAPTTRHTCSSTVEGIDAWCCLPQGAVCSTECDCCGNNYCSYDDNNVGHCVTNPEG
jgi:hypothetical protein